jgi:hypothetical protein
VNDGPLYYDLGKKEWIRELDSLINYYDVINEFLLKV